MVLSAQSENIMSKLSTIQSICLLAAVLFGIQLFYASTITYRLNIMGHHIEHIDTELIPTTKSITEITEYQLKQEVEFEKAFRYALELGQEAQAASHYEHAIAQFDSYNQKIDHGIQITKEELAKAIKHSAVNPQELKSLQITISTIKSEHTSWNQGVHQVFSLLNEQRFHEAEIASQAVEHQAKALEEKVIGALAAIERSTKTAVHQLSNEDRNILLIGLIILGISLAVTLALTYYIVRHLQSDMATLRHEISTLSQGNLSSPVTSRLGLEFGMETMRASLHKTLSIVATSSNKILGASSELAHVCIDVNKSLEQQSNEISVISSAMLELESNSTEVSRHAEDTQRSTKDATIKSNENKKVTEKAMASIVQLTDIIQVTSTNIQELEVQSNKITTVLSVIKGIADQTNLLALNAAIEAARAGEQGRGFAVVADEVRSLAQRTQEATIEIETMINTFGQVTSTAVSSMSNSSNYSNICLDSTEESNTKITEIQKAIAQINEMNDQIASSADLQSSNSQQLSTNTQRIHDLTNENAVSASQLTVTANNMADVARTLQDSLRQFKLS